MKTDVAQEAAAMEPEITKAEDYLSCEKVLINNIKKHLLEGMDDAALQAYAAAMAEHYDTKTRALQHNRVCVNYRYASAFLHALRAAPHLANWIRTTNL